MSDFKALDRLLQGYVDNGLPGCSCMIARRGEILYENYFGYSDVEHQIPLSAQNVFRQASLTKIAMYTVGMMLYEQGKFLMTDPLYEYFPEFRHSTKIIQRSNGTLEEVPTEHPITIKNVFNMTSGLPYELIIGGAPVPHPTSLAMAKAMKPLREKGYFTLREQIRAAASAPLAFEPGTRFLYGFSSELMAGLIEVLSGKPAELVIREMLFEPLDMESSANFLFNDLESRLVKDYYLRPGKQLGEADALYIPTAEHEAKFVGKLGTVPGFARVITNCRDYTKLMQMLANGGSLDGVRVLGRKTVELMASDQLTAGQYADFKRDWFPNGNMTWGLLTCVSKSMNHSDMVRFPGAFGWSGAAGTVAWADPGENLSITFMTQRFPGDTEPIVSKLMQIAYSMI